MEVKQQSPRPFFRPSSGGAFRTSGVGGAALLTPKVEADASASSSTSSGSSVSSASSVLVSTVIKTEPRSDSPCASISMGRFRPPTERYFLLIQFLFYFCSCYCCCGCCCCFLLTFILWIYLILR